MKLTVRWKASQNGCWSAATTGVSAGGVAQLGRLSRSAHRSQRAVSASSVTFLLLVKFLARLCGSTSSVTIQRRDTLSMMKL